MTTNGIHSNAFNFMSAVNTGVDPRTGMYSCSISLPGVAANRLCGPTAQLGLSFSPLNPVDAGFGIGWSLTTTRYDLRRKRLSLSSGESFMVDTFVDGAATFKDRKLRTFDLFRVGVDDDYRIVHKNGHSEHLAVLAGSEGVAVLHELRAPEGHAVTFEHVASNGVVRLRRIRDDAGAVLLSVYEQIAQTHVTLHPDIENAAATFTFRTSNDRLVELALPTGYGDGWLFGYEMKRGRSVGERYGLWRRLLGWLGLGKVRRAEPDLLLLNRVTVPTGGVEEATYVHLGHPLPGGEGSPFSHMPFVTALRRKPGHGQPDMLTRYSYTHRNYFGYGALNDWTDDQDNLYRVVMPPGQRYTYGSTETHYDGIEAIRSIERTFNRFHLLTLERTAQAGCIKEVASVYDEDPGASFDSQVPWCQLPVEMRTRYSVDKPGAKEDSHPFVEQVRTTGYDEHGNVREVVDERGAIERFEYYPVEGAGDLCPRDPLGFVRFLREKRVFPPPGMEGPVRLTRYTHQTLSSLVGGDPDHIVAVTESFFQIGTDAIEVKLSETSHYLMANRGLDHGRSERLVSRHLGIENRLDYTYIHGETASDASGADVPVLITTTHRISSNGRDRHETIATVASSVISGLSVMDRSPNGVVMRYAHDVLGRQVADVVASGSGYAATTTSAYLSAASGSRILKRSVTAQETIVELDGFGVAIRVLASNWNGDGIEHEIWRVAFDALGRKISEVTTDVGLPVALLPPPYAAGAAVPIQASAVSTTTRYVYDGWDNIEETHGADGVVGFHVLDPVAGVAERWEEADGPQGRLRSSRSRVTQTPGGKPARVDTLDANGDLRHSTHSSYDGLDRLIEDIAVVSGEPDRISHFHYDAYDRLVETIRPDGSVIATEYASHTDESLVTAIRIRHDSLGPHAITLGRQAYDGLGRRTVMHAGQRETRYDYDSSTSSVPDRMTPPSGATIAFAYEAHLGDALTRASGGDGETIFTYDPTTGDKLSVSNDWSEHTMEYDESGHLSAEAFRHDGATEARTCAYHYSLRGKLTDYTDVNGDTHRLIYDDIGRFVRMECSEVSVDVAYDAFSRPVHTLTLSRDGSRSMDVRVSLDEYDRDVERVVTAQSDSVVVAQSLVQSYTPDGKLATRRLSREGGVRDETFAYDLRGRLAVYACSGDDASSDASGRPLAGQTMSYDALDNVIEMVSTYLDGSLPEIRRYTYAEDDPSQLRGIVIEQGGRKVDELVFSYDRAGNFEHDERGRQLFYDTLGRPTGWSSAGAYRRYRYDASGRIGLSEDGQGDRHRYYVDGKISRNEGKTDVATYRHVGGAAVAHVSAGANGDGAILLGGDSQGSVIAEAGARVTTPGYTPHGYSDHAEATSDVGFTGELRERDVDWTILGHYRAYNPVILRFHGPDAASPFGHGGLNAYAYCSGDPVNRSDPSGEGWLDWLFVGIGVIASGIAIAASGGTLAPAIGAVVSLTATASQATAVALVAVDVTSIGLGIGSAVAADVGNDALAGKLGLASMMLGVGGLSATVGPSVLFQAGKQGRRFLAATRYVRPAAVRSPLALKAPRLRGGGDMTGTNPYGAPLPSVMPSDDALRGMNGFQRVNAAVDDVAMRRHMISRGFLSPQLLDRFPDGIDLANRASVIRARHTLSMALLDEEGLNAGMLARSGFDAGELASLNPSHVPGPPLTLSPERRRALLRRAREGVVDEGEQLYTRFLATGHTHYLLQYWQALVRARVANRWGRWNSPSNSDLF